MKQIIPAALAIILFITHPASADQLTSVMHGQALSGAYGGIECFEHGLCFAGFRTDSMFGGARIRRSMDYGLTWSEAIAIPGAESARTYYFARHGNVILASGGSGSAGPGEAPNIFRSTDLGVTWDTVANKAALTALPHCSEATAVYNIVYVGNNTFIAGLESVPVLIKSTDDGLTWNYYKTLAGWSIRRIRDMGDGNILAMALGSGVWKSADHGLTWNKKSTSPASVFTSCNVGNGVYLAGTAGSGGKAIRVSTRSRLGNIATIRTAQPHLLAIGQKIGIYGMEDPGFDARPYTSIISIPDDRTFIYQSTGSDTEETNDSTGTVKTAGNQAIYRSTDYGETWKKVATVTAYSDMTYVRTIIHLGNGIVTAFVAANEYSQTDRGMQTYMSRDYGQTWEWVANPYTSPHGELNAIYDAVQAAPGIFIMGAQPDSNILRLIIPVQ